VSVPSTKRIVNQPVENGPILAAGRREVTSMHASTIRRAITSSALTMLFLLSVSSVATAQAYISPFIGFNFGGDSGCPEISNCEDKKRNWGVAFGRLGSVFGTEAEFSFIDSFFGETPGVSSHVLTFMGNVMVAPKFGVLQPYGLFGLGLIKSHAELTAVGLLDNDNNDFGWDIGGGAILYFGQSFGVRGDIRHFHSFEDLNLLGISLSDTKLDFGRASVGAVFKF
jgi:opacity protein-like surface antigen